MQPFLGGSLGGLGSGLRPLGGGQADLQRFDLAARHGLSRDDLIARHCAPVYRVYVVGFQPGFSYLGGLDPVLATPRRAEPRANVPAQSIMIGGAQTAISSVETPSGWHLIGLCPTPLFDVAQVPPCPLAPGDRVRFEPVDEAAYRRACGA